MRRLLACVLPCGCLPTVELAFPEEVAAEAWVLIGRLDGERVAYAVEPGGIERLMDPGEMTAIGYTIPLEDLHSRSDRSR